MAPRRYLVFLWMAYHNKVLTRDNLSKRQVVEDITCLFCAESESVAHLFFYCIVAKEIWTVIAEIFNFAIRCSMSDLAVLWCVDNKKSVVAISCVAVIWSIWTLRNDLCFQGSVWTSTQTLLGRVSAMLHQWKILCVDTQSELLRRRLQLLDRRRGELLRIAWWRSEVQAGRTCCQASSSALTPADYRACSKKFTCCIVSCSSLLVPLVFLPLAWVLVWGWFRASKYFFSLYSGSATLAVARALWIV